MSIWISGSIPEVITATHSGLVHAIYAGASTLSRWVRAGQPVSDALRAVGDAAPYALFVQIRGPERAIFIEEARMLRTISPLAQACLPADAEGLAAAAELSEADEEVMVTGVGTLRQAFLAAQAEPVAIAVPVNLLYEAGQDPGALLRQCRSLFDHLGCGAFIMGSDLSTPAQVEVALAAGVDGLILSFELFQQLSQSPVTQRLLRAAEAAYTEMGKGQPGHWLG